ncbi:hypothetical protein [Thermodesulfobacterium hydrogeniphilum]|uniref:hypothetical protein n=1 Tax=Thermodesulfobacterium hydrogeniphilum TaxID=161156 RepID=UPI0005709538|nr:hypothetical protein [Thermodesulfobacterium hydrogeniphilum]
MQVYEIIENIKKLPEKDLKILLKWIEDYEQKLWDQEFERDVRLGKLDKLAEQAIKDFQAGKCREL